MQRIDFTLRLVLSLVLSLAAAQICVLLHTPLPWMIGPMLATAACGVAGLPVQSHTAVRNAGQWVIGTALGLYFTPAVGALVVQLVPVLLAGVAWALLLGYGFYRWLLWANRGLPGVDEASSFYAAAIGGASEMASLAERVGARVDLVASCHSLRLMLIVLLVPFGFEAWGVRGIDASLLAGAGPAQSAKAVAALVVASLLGVALFAKLRLPNPWVLGSMAAAALWALASLPAANLPPAVVNGGQLCIGLALGSRFTPAFVHAAPRWLASVALGTVVMIAASLGFAFLLAPWSGLHPATLALATAPGGIAEMCITAKVLQLGAPVVTAFHVVRYAAVMLGMPTLWRWERGRLARVGKQRRP